MTDATGQLRYSALLLPARDDTTLPGRFALIVAHFAWVSTSGRRPNAASPAQPAGAIVVRETRFHPSDVDVAFGEISLWRQADPQSAAIAALDVYGPGALTAAAYCALDAHFDGRKHDYQFWHNVFLSLGGDRRDATAETLPRPTANDPNRP